MRVAMVMPLLSFLPFTSVFMTDLDIYFFVLVWRKRHAACSTSTPSLFLLPNCVQMEQHMKGRCQEWFAVNAPQRPGDFSPNIRSAMIAPLINLNSGGKGETDGGGVAAKASFKYTYKNKDFLLQKWSLHVKESFWDRTLSAANGNRAVPASPGGSPRLRTAPKWGGGGVAFCYSPINVCR